MTEELGRISGYGGRLHTPILDEDRVVVSYLNSSWGNLARPLHRYVAFNKGSGAIQWWAAPGGQPLDTTYSAPVTAVMGGRRMLVAATADGNAYGMLARNGVKRGGRSASANGVSTLPSWWTETGRTCLTAKRTCIPPGWGASSASTEPDGRHHRDRRRLEA